MIALTLVMVVAVGCGQSANRTTTEVRTTPAAVSTSQPAAAEADIEATIQARVQATLSGAAAPTAPAAGAVTPEIPNPVPTAAPIATATTAPTATAAPTPTVPASPTAKPEAKVAVTEYIVHKDDFATYVYGELENSGNVTVSGIQLAVSLLDDGGKVLASGVMIDNMQILEAGQKTPFRAMIDKAPASWASERLQVQAEPAGDFILGRYSHQVEAIDVRVVEPENEYGWVSLVGELRNTGDEPVQLAKAIVAVRDAEGKIIMVSSGFSKLQQLDPGMSAPFGVDFLGLKTIEDYTLVVEAHTL